MTPHPTPTRAPTTGQRSLTGVMLLVALACARDEPAVGSDCAPFRDALDRVPHVSLSVHEGSFRSLADDARFEGCEIRFQTTDSLSAGSAIPDFEPLEGSDSYAAGWRPTEGVMADGPGSSIYGIERDDVACVISWDQPAGIDDDGTFFQSDTLDIVVQCRRLGSGD